MLLLIWTVFSGERCGPWASCFFENYVILYYKNNFTIYLVILSDFDQVKLQQFFEKFLWMFYKNHWLHIERTLTIYIKVSETVDCYQMFHSFEHALRCFDMQY